MRYESVKTAEKLREWVRGNNCLFWISVEIARYEPDLIFVSYSDSIKLDFQCRHIIREKYLNVAIDSHKEKCDAGHSLRNGNVSRHSLANL